MSVERVVLSVPTDAVDDPSWVDGQALWAQILDRARRALDELGLRYSEPPTPTMYREGSVLRPDGSVLVDTVTDDVVIFAFDGEALA